MLTFFTHVGLVIKSNQINQSRVFTTPSVYRMMTALVASKPSKHVSDVEVKISSFQVFRTS